MADQNPDPRLHAYRSDIAAASLEGQVEAAKFVEGEIYQCACGLANLHGKPSPENPLVSQLLFGEIFTVYDIQGDWAWGQAKRDGYVGYCPLADLSPDIFKTTHYVDNLSTHIYPAPDAKLPPLERLHLMSDVSVISEKQTNGFVQLADGNWVFATHIAKEYGRDPVAEALKFLYTPYLWGGRSSEGLDCSALVQLAFATTGVSLSRDCDLIEDQIGRTLKDDEVPQHGDVAFFPGHVGFMLDDMHLLHANMHHMRVSIDPLREVIDIVSFQTDEPPLKFIKRPT